MTWIVHGFVQYQTVEGVKMEINKDEIEAMLVAVNYYLSNSPTNLKKSDMINLRPRLIKMLMEANPLTISYPTFE